MKSEILTRLQQSVGKKPQSGEMFIENGDIQIYYFRLERNAGRFAKSETKTRRLVPSINIACLTALFFDRLLKPGVNENGLPERIR
jgi:hypothetical protein